MTRAPLPEGCEWCGVGRREHAQRWTAPYGWHTFLQPTRTTIERRMRLARALPTTPDQP